MKRDILEKLTTNNIKSELCIRQIDINYYIDNNKVIFTLIIYK